MSMSRDDSDLTVAHMVGHGEGRKVGRAEMLPEVLRVVEEYKKYVELLGEELDELVPIAAAHGWKSSRYDKGVVCRENIKRLLSELEANG